MLSPCFISQDIGQYEYEPRETYEYAQSNHSMDDDKGVLRKQCALDIFGRCNHR